MSRSLWGPVQSFLAAPMWVETPGEEEVFPEGRGRDGRPQPLREEQPARQIRPPSLRAGALWCWGNRYGLWVLWKKEEVRETSPWWLLTCPRGTSVPAGG